MPNPLPFLHNIFSSPPQKEAFSVEPIAGDNYVSSADHPYQLTLSPLHSLKLTRSATVDLDLFSRYLDICPVITVRNRTHCMTTCFLEDVHESINFRLASDSPALEDAKQVPETRGKKNLVLSGWGDETLLSEEYVNPNYVPHNYQSHGEELNLRRMYKDVSDVDLLEDLVYVDETCGEGAILVFLPGVSDIHMLYDKLTASYLLIGFFH